MARGFESKDVEFQQAEAERSRPNAPVLTPEQREQAARRQTLALALARARTEFAQTASPIRRGVLSDAIAGLVRQIESLVAVDAR